MTMVPMIMNIDDDGTNEYWQRWYQWILFVMTTMVPMNFVDDDPTFFDDDGMVPMNIDDGWLLMIVPMNIDDDTNVS